MGRLFRAASSAQGLAADLLDGAAARCDGGAETCVLTLAAQLRGKEPRDERVAGAGGIDHADLRRCRTEPDAIGVAERCPERAGLDHDAPVAGAKQPHLLVDFTLAAQDGGLVVRW